MSIVFTICETFSPDESSVANRVCELVERLDLATPHTTRQPRSAEDDGFVFTSQDTFERMIAGEEFLEYVQIFGNYYGTPRYCLQEAQENGKDLLIKVDERGAARIKRKLPDTVSILVLHSSSGQHEPATGSTVNELLNQRLHDASQKMDPDKFDQVVSNDRVQENAAQASDRQYGSLQPWQRSLQDVATAKLKSALSSRHLPFPHAGVSMMY